MTMILKKTSTRNWKFLATKTGLLLKMLHLHDEIDLMYQITFIFELFQQMKSTQDNVKKILECGIVLPQPGPFILIFFSKMEFLLLNS